MGPLLSMIYAICFAVCLFVPTIFYLICRITVKNTDAKCVGINQHTFAAVLLVIMSTMFVVGTGIAIHKYRKTRVSTYEQEMMNSGSEYATDYDQSGTAT